MGVVRSCLLAWVTACLAAGEQLPTIVFSPGTGLHPTVNRILADSKGFLWIPGSDGLVRFDGNGFRLFTPADGLPASRVSDIVERRDGTYWIASEDRLCLFDPRPHANRFQCESPNLGAIRTLLEDDLRLWCASETGLWRRPDATARHSPFIRAIEPDANGGAAAAGRLLKDSRGDVWANTFSGLYRFRRNGRIDHWPRTRGVEFDLDNALAETPGAIWAGTETNLLRFGIDPQSGEARISAQYNRSHGLPSAYTVDVRVWRGAIWAATFQGLARQLPSGRWQAIDLDPSIRGLPLAILATDRLGNLWVGIDGGGAVRVSDSGIAGFSEREGLGVRRVWAVFEDRNGNLMAVTKDETHYYLNRFDGDRFVPIRPHAPSGISWSWSWSQIALESRSGDWWLTTGSGLLRFRHGLAGDPEVALRGYNVFRVFEDASGAIWASVNAISNNRLYRRDPVSGSFEQLDEKHGLPPLRENGNTPAVFAETPGGDIWIGMLDRGIVRYRNGRFQQFPRASGAPDQGVRSLLTDRQGRLWIGSRNRGLLRIDDPAAAQPVFHAYARARGLSENTVSMLAEDLQGRIYTAGRAGIDRVDPATGRVRHFAAADGLQGELRVAFRDRRGALWFGGDQGLFRLEPREERSEPPPVLVHSIRVNGANAPVSDVGDAEPAPLSLSSSQRQVQVDFGGFRSDLLYQTRLSGVDPDWTAPSPSRTIHYLSLAPGGYDLALRAVDSEGAVSSRPALVRFRIAAPVWQRWWFRLAALMALAGMAYLIYRIRVGRLLEMERLRMRIATDLHDDIGASLSQIAILSEVAREGGGEPLARIASVSRELVDSMSDIVWAVSPHRDRLTDLVQRMRQFAEDVLVARGMRFELRVETNQPNLSLDPEVRREVFLIFKECIHNSVRHSGCERVEAELRAEAGWLELSLRDDGQGLDGAAQPGHGLGSIRRRARDLGGDLEITSRRGDGVAILVRVPLSRGVRRRMGSA